MSGEAASKPYKHDLFISYAHIDNASLFEDQPKGWVDRFHFALDMRLQQLVGGPVTIWRDKKLPGGDYFDDRIQAALLDSAILVSILSPRYLNSEWCMKEITASGDRTARVWRVGWKELLKFLRSRTTACLIVDQRLQYLAEEKEEAQKQYEACERRYGRVP